MSSPAGDADLSELFGRESRATRPGTGPGRRPGEADRYSVVEALKRPAAVGVVLATGAYLSVFYHIVDVVGGAGFLAMELALTAVAAAWLGGFLRERTAVGLTAVGFALALVGYFLSVPRSARALFTVGRLLGDLLALLTGLSVLRLLNVGAWALFLAPVPTFLSVYLLVRRQDVSAVAVALVTTGFFVSTGDAGAGVGLAAAVGATVAVGFAGLAAAGRRGVLAQWDTLAVVVAAMVVCTSLVTVVPGSATNPVLPGGKSPTVESSLVTNSDSVGVLGSIRLSPEVRFTVEADRPAYWRVGAYDRYTGGRWVRTGEKRPYDGSIRGPPGESERLTQRITVRATLDAIPAAWKPVEVRGRAAETAQVTALGGLVPGTSLLANDSYTVVSERPRASARQLRRAGVDYPTEIRSRYTQLPDSTPDRVAERTDRVLEQAGATTPYDAAVAIERYLERTKEYSLEVPSPKGNVADRFLFEMQSGYCVYFATTMVAMLRTQGVPARFVVGYTPGQRVDEDKWVVRGLDSHAWVEVYFPGHGWIRFDPTPSAPRERAEQTTVEAARQEGVAGVDTAGSASADLTTPTPTPGADGSAGETPAFGEINPEQGGDFGNASVTDIPGGGLTAGTPAGLGGGVNGGDGGDERTPWAPTRGEAALGLAAALGAVAGARRFGLTARVSRAYWLVRQPRADPDTDAERAFRRLEYLAALVYRPRRTGETPRAFLETLAADRFGERASAVGRAFERARYGGGADEESAREAVEAVDELVREHAPVLRRFGGAG